MHGGGSCWPKYANFLNSTSLTADILSKVELSKTAGRLPTILTDAVAAPVEPSSTISPTRAIAVPEPSPRIAVELPTIPIFKPHEVTKAGALAAGTLSPPPPPDLTPDVHTRKRKQSDVSVELASGSTSPSVEATNHLPTSEKPKAPSIPTKKFKKKTVDPFIPVPPRVR
jgi:hypothetical protein